MINPELEKNNYIILRNFISKERAKDLAEDFILQSSNFTSDPQSPWALSKYNYKYFLYLLCEKTFDVSSIYGNYVIPTYCYARYYKNGGMLAKHTDRPSCEISITLNLKKDRNWPIYINTPNGSVATVELDPGDAMMYRGCTAPHWREKKMEGNWVQVFLHYVDLHGNNYEHYFDRLNDVEKNN